MTRSSTPAWPQRLISELDASDRRAEQLGRGLTTAQLNWSGRPGAWSVGQCLDHLLVTNNVYLPAIAAALVGQPRSPVQEVTIGFWTRRFIKQYVAPLTTETGSRTRAPKKIKPAAEVNVGVLDDLLRSNVVARELVTKASDYDVNRLRFKNPFIPLLRFTVGAGLEIVAKHESRHLAQAERVRQSSGFPRV
ncbi:MAG: DinB family protein [Vicinamibacterales bacterium]